MDNPETKNEREEESEAGLTLNRAAQWILLLVILALLSLLFAYDHHLYLSGRPAVFAALWDRTDSVSKGIVGSQEPAASIQALSLSVEEVAALQDQIDAYLESASIREHDWIDLQHVPRFSPEVEEGEFLERARTVLVPASYDTAVLFGALPTGGVLSLVHEDTTAVLITPAGVPVYSLSAVAKEPYYAVRRRARVAVVIDDCGYGGRIEERLIRLPYDLTFAVLPYLPRTREFARSAAAKGREVLLHLPMEPIDRAAHNPGKGAILVNMTDTEIHSALLENLEQVPEAVGVNNHMGSLATSDPRIMQTVLTILRDRNLFYLDSWTSPGSVAMPTARMMGIPTGRNDIFLDNVHSEQAVLAQLEKARQLALERGDVICIGHATSSWTLYTLEDVLPRWRREGIEVVSVSELMR